MDGHHGGEWHVCRWFGRRLVREVPVRLIGRHDGHVDAQRHPQRHRHATYWIRVRLYHGELPYHYCEPRRLVFAAALAAAALALATTRATPAHPLTAAGLKTTLGTPAHPAACSPC